MEKTQLTRRIKLLEIMITARVRVALWTGNIWVLLGQLFLMGTQSAYFGQVKYSIMTEHLKEAEIVAGLPVIPAQVTADGLRETVTNLRGDRR